MGLVSIPQRNVCSGGVLQSDGSFWEMASSAGLLESNESPKIMGLKGIHSPEALKWCAGQLFCPWCGKEGQNESTVEIINVLCTTV